jgi:hypothetical protein
MLKGATEMTTSLHDLAAALTQAENREEKACREWVTSPPRKRADRKAAYLAASIATTRLRMDYMHAIEADELERVMVADEDCDHSYEMTDTRRTGR